MSEHLAPLHAAIDALDAVWAEAVSAHALSRSQLIAANDAVGVLRRRLDALHAEIAAGIAHESRPELGPGSLAKEQGFRSTATLIAATGGGSTGDAARLVKVGEATAPRLNLLGEVLPSKYPAVQAALTCGAVSAAVAAAIISLLDRVWVKVGAARVAEAEVLLVERAPGLSMDDVRKLITRAEAWLDPDGVPPREEEARAARSLTMFERDGMLHLTAKLDIAAAAPVKTAIQGMVSAVFRTRTHAVDPDAPDADRRTVPMLQADALSEICAHAIGCKSDDLPLAGATVIVRVDLTDLDTGTGCATIDGFDTPVSITTCRRLAANGGAIPWVLGGDGEILDWGRQRRLFTRAQRQALVTRDGGCTMCGIDPELTRAHHLRWWHRDTGPTDLNNAVLLCESCHHRIHDNGWDIHIDGPGVGGRVWLIPPPHIDPHQRPRLGGRARYDIAA